MTCEFGLPSSLLTGAFCTNIKASVDEELNLVEIDVFVLLLNCLGFNNKRTQVLGFFIMRNILCFFNFFVVC